MQERYPSSLKRAGDFVRKFLSEVTASIVTTACIAAATTAYLSYPAGSPPIISQKPDMAVLLKPASEAAAIQVSSLYNGAASTLEPNAASTPARMAEVPLPPRRPKIVSSPLRAQYASVNRTFLAPSLLAPSSVAPEERDPSSPSALASSALASSAPAPSDFDESGHERVVADRYGTSPITQLPNAPPSQKHEGDASGVLISAMADARDRGADVLHSMRGLGSSLIDTLPRVWP